MSSVDVRDLVVAHPGRPPALDGVSLALAPGEQVALLGPSGAGKSTLLRALLGAAPLSNGRVRVRGLDPYDDRDRQAVLRGTGTVLQGGGLVPGLSARTNVVSGASHLLDRGGWWAVLRGRTPGGLAARVHALAAAQGVEPLLDQPVSRLSGGQRQRVALVRALLSAPGLLLADEPTTGLDPSSATDAVGALREQRVTLLVATHDPAVAAAFDRVVGLRAGRVVHDGPPLAPRQAAALYAREP